MAKRDPSSKKNQGIFFDKVKKYQLLQKNIATRTELLAPLLHRPRDLRVGYVNGAQPKQIFAQIITDHHIERQ